jgi:hypothetical protein
MGKHNISSGKTDENSKKLDVGSGVAWGDIGEHVRRARYYYRIHAFFGGDQLSLRLQGD